MTDFSMPSMRIRGFRFGLSYNTQVFESPFSRAIQRRELDGARWTAQYQFTLHKREEVAAFQAFLANLQGRVNRFNAYDPAGVTPRGSASSTPGTPVVNGGSQTGSSINVDGLPASASSYLLAGDYFSVNGELKMVTSTVASDGDGEAEINFEPPLRASPADNASITVSNTIAPMIALNDDMAAWDVDHNGLYQVTLAGYEAFS